MKWASAGLAILLLTPAAIAQSPSFRSETDAVRVDVSVTRGGVPVQGLTLDDFELADSGVAQRIHDLSVGTVPLNLLLLLDVSGSISGAQLSYLKQAAHAVVNRLRPIDHVAVMTFSNAVRRDITWSSNTPAVHGAIDQLAGSWRTSLYDAVSVATSMRAAAPPGRMHVLLVSDGWDTTSWLSPLVVLSQLRRSDLVLHVVRLSFPVNIIKPSDLTAARERRQLFLPSLPSLRLSFCQWPRTTAAAR
jgi:VWFA-related protein